MRLIVILFVGCLSLTSSGQTFNQEYYSESGAKFLLGPIKPDRLTQGDYGQWYNSGFAEYQVDQTQLTPIKTNINDYSIRLFLGTWCGDSKREVPRMLKIIEDAGYSLASVEIFAVDRRREYLKSTPGEEAAEDNIVRVPTLIFFKDGKETNRIIEKPVKSLEEDMARILQQLPYTPHYANMRRSD